MNKLYVVVRRDLSKVYAAVQGGHAVAKWVDEYRDTAYNDWRNGYLIYVSVADEDELKAWFDLCKDDNLNVSLFNEPDLDEQATAFACLCSNKDRLFKNLPLL